MRDFSYLPPASIRQVDVPSYGGATPAIDILMRPESLPSITSYLSNLLRNAPL